MWRACSQFLKRFDVVTSKEAEKALISAFATRPELMDELEINGPSSHLTARPIARPSRATQC